jgi:SAM-dependent methyltransferase
MNLRTNLKKSRVSKYGVLLARQLRTVPGRTARFAALRRFLASYRVFSTHPKNTNSPASVENLYPRLFDDTSETKIDPVYFYQNAWCARKIFTARPETHYDIGSAIPLVSILSQFVPVTMVDIRPLPASLSGLSFIEGTITGLPFADRSIQSLSSICVLEHIGLGRYGDPLDPFGSEKAAHELIRVLAPGGNLYITVPVDKSDLTFFNAHRTFTRDGALALFPGLTLIEETYQYGMGMQDSYDPSRGFGTGMYHFKKSNA